VSLFEYDNIPHFSSSLSPFVANGIVDKYYPMSLSNRHCVIFVDELSSEEVKVSESILNRNSMFANRTNVQFAKIIDENNIAIEIWECGVEYTLVSSSSACAVFIVARKTTICSDNVKIDMPGGILNVELSRSRSII
jgi:diaminopimelate epimerase